MAHKFGTAVRDARANVVESTIGTAPILQLRTGPPPAAPATADSGTLLAEMTLPSDWLGASSSGVKSKSGTWEDASANASGRAAHFRIKDSGGTVTHWQGIVAMAWQAGTAYLVGDYVTNDTGKLYVCDQAGTSAGAGGPTGTGSNITDNTARWDYLQAATDMAIDNAVIAATQAVSVSAFAFTEGNA